MAGINKQKEEEAAAPVNKRSKRPGAKPPSADPAVSLSESETIRLVNQPEAGRPPSDRCAANDRS
ncbi:MAG: hypothetical protein U0797_04515 [Gemmataceae bacterium]